MNFTINKNIISSAMTTCLRAVKNNSTVPALEGVLLKAYNGKLTIIGWDLVTRIETVLDEFLEVFEEGEVVVSAKILNEIIKKSPEGNIGITSTEKDETNTVVRIKAGRSSYKIVGIESSKYPPFSDFESNINIKISGKTLKDAINSTVYATTNDNKKPVYTGSLFEFNEDSLNIVACDGFRMAVKKVTLDTGLVDYKIVIPNAIQKEVVKTITNDSEVTILSDDRNVMFKIGNITLSSRQIEGTFMNWKALIKATSNKSIINKSQFSESIDRLSVLKNATNTTLKVTFNDSDVNLEISTTVGKAHDNISCEEYQGEETLVGLNPFYLQDALKAIDNDVVQINIETSEKPILITPVDRNKDFIHMIVPMRFGN